MDIKDREFCYCGDCNILVVQRESFTIEYTDVEGMRVMLSLCPDCFVKRGEAAGVYGVINPPPTTLSLNTPENFFKLEVFKDEKIS